MSNDKYQRIWETVKLIPKGKVATYGQVADLAGLPGRARMVGKALQFAPHNLSLPWYRVINSQGKISFPDGSEHFNKQRSLLQEEQVVVLRGRIKLRDFLWQPDLSELLMSLRF